jgi:acyl dehydratase
LAIEPAVRRGPDLQALAALEFPIVRYEVSREKIAEYVVAIGDRNPLSSDPEVARRAGYRDVIAPPTFAAVFSSLPFRRALADREWVARSTIDPARILHGEQRYEFRRPVLPGDRLLVQSIVTGVEERKGLVFVYVATRVDDERSERVLDATMTLVLRP